MNPDPITELFNRLLLFGAGIEAGELPAPYAYSLRLGTGGTSEDLGTWAGVATFSVTIPFEVSGDSSNYSLAQATPVLPE